MKRRNFLSWLGAVLAAPFVPVRIDAAPKMTVGYGSSPRVYLECDVAEPIGHSGFMQYRMRGKIMVSAEEVAAGRPADIHRHLIPPPQAGYVRSVLCLDQDHDGRTLNFSMLDCQVMLKTRIEHEQAIHDELMKIRESIGKELKTAQDQSRRMAAMLDAGLSPGL